ncbi:MAG: hypothetical protein JJ879_08955 [Sneathiella sp.]|nr:hypothetical protein [Sneathiella sp.]
MVIAPEILIPSATLAVAILVAIVRLITGSKSVVLSEKTCRDFLNLEVPEINGYLVELNDKHTLALIKTVNGQPFGLIRGFGDKLVYQSLSSDDVSEDKNHHTLKIKRSGLAHPAVTFTPENMERGWV